MAGTVMRHRVSIASRGERLAGVFAELMMVQASVEPTGLEQLLVPALFHDAAVVEYHQPVGPQDRA